MQENEPPKPSTREGSAAPHNRRSVAMSASSLGGDYSEPNSTLASELNARIMTLNNPNQVPSLSLGLKRKAENGKQVSMPLNMARNVDFSNQVTPRSIFTYFTKSESEPKTQSPRLLIAKKQKINAGIPVAEIRKLVEEKRLEAKRYSVIPPISKEEPPITAGAHQDVPETATVKNMELDAVPDEYPPLEATPIYDFLQKAAANPESNEFIYLVGKLPTPGTEARYNPYNLRIVEFHEIDTSSTEGYYTMSGNGVTHINNMGEGSFTPINKWIREYDLFHKLLRVPFFAKYRKWKCFSLWKSTVLHGKVHNARTSLEKNLFICNPILRQALLKINGMNTEVLKSSLLSVGEDTMELKDFVEEQERFIYKNYVDILEPWESKLNDLVKNACKSALLKCGFDVPDEESEETKKLSFTEQAARRTECRKLTRFVKMVDYMIVSTLQYLVIETAQHFLKISFQGCQDSDVAIDNQGGGTMNISQVYPGASKPKESEISDEGSKYTTIQVGGVVVGDEIGTSTIATCGYNRFSDILCRLISAKMPVLNLVEVIEEEAPVGEDFSLKLKIRKGDQGNKKSEEPLKLKHTEKQSPFVPLFRTEILMDTEAEDSPIYFSSSLPDYLTAVDLLLKRYLFTIEKIGLITNTIQFLDPSSSPSGNYSAVRDLDEPEYGIGPQANLIVLDSAYFKEICGRIRGVFVGIYSNIGKWVVRLQPLRQTWLENQTFDVLKELRETLGEETYQFATYSPNSSADGVALPGSAKVKALTQNREEAKDEFFCLLDFGVTAQYVDEDTGVRSFLAEFFEKLLKKYSEQKEIMAAVPTRSTINNILIETSKLKNILIPSPERCFNDVSKILPGLARDKNELLLTEIQTWHRILKSLPSNVEGFVEYLGWLQNIRKKIDFVDSLAAEVAMIYELLERYKIYILPTDLAMYQTLSPTLRTLKESLELALDCKEDNITKFTVDLEKMIQELSSEISDIRNATQDPMVLSSNSNYSDVIAYLEDLQKQLQKVEVLKNKYEDWISMFKRGGESEGAVEIEQQDAVELRDHSELDETKQEIDMKHLLWSSLKEWEEITNGWKKNIFDNLVTDEINNNIQQYLKIAHKLDKGLPPNEVVPKLKEVVEEYRKIFPTIVNLRNPSLKSRHWEKIEDAIGRPLPRDETFTLGYFIDHQVFEFKEEISLISSQAGSEASLDEMLNKVIRVWNDLEFLIMPYRDIKDVYILGSVEDVQTALEDSQVTIATIKGSRFIGPIKSEVERWDKMLSLFSETLDQWLTCQRSWLYLESIFSAPDIQRQLPDEARMFSQVDRSWKDIMRKVARNPNAIKAGTMPGALEMMQQNNLLLEQIQKCLEDYLESKRLLFPRFYFLSNDELLEILSQTKNPHAVQPHLSKCFDAIKSLEFATKDSKSIDIVGMNSPEGEKVMFLKTIKARGNVEGWLGSVEEAMFAVLKRLIKVALTDYEESKRVDWVTEHAGQVVVTGNQVLWSRDVTEALKASDSNKALHEVLQRSVKNLSALAALVRGDLTKIQRAILGALITIDVHNRDIVNSLIESSVSSPGDFEWTKQQRYYWDIDSDTCQVKMSTSIFMYGYEYLGCSSRLVITPLTDRCYLTLTGAMQLNLGGSPVGPAGTGKTETVKDLAKALAKQCVVFNCSDGMDYKMMGKMFAGLAQSGAWCCFDEFNRIDIEVLSVIAQQLLTIKNAKDQKVSRFIFEGKDIRLIETCAAFITMNPGYAGRTELPDNLKALFRPISMMIPDYGLIAEIMLFSEGFESAKILSGKVVNLYKLCSEQLSQQDHYDFGMRAVKSVLVMAGALKRSNPELNEEVVLIRSLRDSNLPKFLAEDIGLFRGILSDLFPGVEVPERDFGTLVGTIKEVMLAKNLKIIDPFISRICQLAETMRIRHGVMLVGPTGGGKTTCYQVLQESLTKLASDGNKEFQKVQTFVLNPKCISMTELYGEFNNATMEWKDGLIGNIFRSQVADNSADDKWTVCDGPVDALWIENMNTVLDDNKLLTLINGERIKMSSSMHMLFEVGDLAVASPATVSRCGMVYMDPSILGWRAYVHQWFSKSSDFILEEWREYLFSLFETFVDVTLNFINKNGKEYIKTTDQNRVSSLCKLLESHFRNPNWNSYKSLNELKQPVTSIFIFCLVWSLGGNLSESSCEIFDTWFRELLDTKTHIDVHIPVSHNLFGFYADYNRGFIPWEDIIPPFKYSPEIPYFQMVVPTTETVKYSYLLNLLVKNSFPVLICGESGVGKSIIVQETLAKITKEEKCLNVVLNFSAQTSSPQTQQQIELKTEKKRKNIFGAPGGFKKINLFVDDLNMPKLDTYGSQPTIELLRQFLDYQGFYDREKLFWKILQDISLVAACAPPGGGRNQLSKRFLRHFNVICGAAPSEVSLAKIFRNLVEGFLKPFSAEVKSCSEAIVNSSINIYHRMRTELLPTPAKSHYTFNLRDLSKVVQGILQVKPSTITSKLDVARLFCHESSRVFHDRLIDKADREVFNNLLSNLCEVNFGIKITAESLSKEPIIFCDFSKRGVAPEDRIYLEVADMKFMSNLLDEYLEEYNVTMSQEMRIIFFLDAKQHITRISRIIRQPRGNALLVGVGGTGKQSLTKLACHISDFQCIQIELTRSYGTEEWREDLKKLYRSAGVSGKNTVFLLSDTQIKSESFLEDINNILNSGEVPNLLEMEDREKILGELRPIAREKGMSEDRDTVYQLFISRVRDNLHIVLGTSPVGDTFRDRCRMFPSLVNCCTIDWFDEWPNDALLSVSSRFLEFVDLGDQDMKNRIAMLCVEIHNSVGEIAKKFWAELRRKYYTTPTSYLELINLYVLMLSEKRKELGAIRDRLRNGLSKLAETNELVASMQVELNSLGPELKLKAADTEELMIKIIKDQEKADGVKTVVGEEEAIVRKVTVETEAIAQDAQKDLDEAVPALESAFKALDALEKKDIAELKVFSKPPEAVLMVMDAICILFKCKPDWENSKKLLGDPQFMKKMQEYDKDSIPEAITKKLKKYIEMPAFNPETVERVSKACKSMCMWVIAMELYSRIFKEVAPKRKRLEEAQASLEEMRKKLEEKTAALAEVENQLEVLKSTYENSVASKKLLLEKMDETTKRLARANKLTTALADEQVRWSVTVESLNEQIESLVGNIFLSAASIAYFGAFTSTFRTEVVRTWIAKCKELEIPVSENFSLVSTLSDPATIRDWNIQGLPADEFSSENGLLVKKGRRWPLMIDPQGQANRWIKNMEGNELKVLKLTEPKFLRSLENSVRTGQPVLIEDVGEQLDPALEPLLLKQTIRQGGRVLMKLGDSLVEFDRNFRLYITTKLSNPHYLPEVCIKVTIINFTVTKIGLEGQLLADVVKLERAELEEQRNSLIVNIAADKKQLKDIEDKILKLLFSSQGNILDDEELINTLNQSKITSATINTRLGEAQVTESNINSARERYRPVAIRGSVLYFVMANLAEIDPMYHFSLKYFKNLFINTIKVSEQSDMLNTRIQTIISNITYETFSNISRGLFEAHKLIFAFIICVDILMEKGMVDSKEWNFFLRGSGLIRSDLPDPPEIPWISQSMWTNFCDLAFTVPQFQYVVEHIHAFPTDWDTFIEADDPFTVPIPGDTTGQLSDFHKLILIKVLREEYLVAAIIDFIKRNMGQEFVDIPPLDLMKVYKDTSVGVPLIFILSTGSDPVNQLMRFAASPKINMAEKLHMISLGQGQGPIAEELVKKALISGDWVFLQNCHLAASWMLRLENIVKENSLPEANIAPGFRLFLSSMPSNVFPVSVLQESVKITNEPPKGLRANLARSFNDVSKDLFDDHPPQGVKFKKMLFGLCFFNAIIHERKKFGPLGWNILYDWSNSDLEVSSTILSNMLQEYKNVPWEALLYLTGEIAFGGRVTDDWDRRTVRSILSRFYTPLILDDNYHFSPSGIYHAPVDGDLASFRSYIDGLPYTEEPSIFGMHENANISYQLQEARRVVKSVLDVQPKLSTSASGKSSEEIVLELATTILQKWPKILELDPSDTQNISVQILFRKDPNGRILNSLSTVLYQETMRFNKLTAHVRLSLENICKALKGLIVMSSDLERVFLSLINNKVPEVWAAQAYPSLKGLASWIIDYHQRVNMISHWIKNGQPATFWLPGFFYPQGFLTGVLQNHARKYNVPIDSLIFSYEVTSIHETDLLSIQSAPEGDGALIGGLFLEGARWDAEKKLIQDSFPMEMFSTMPLIRFVPVQTLKNVDKTFVCPLYKTSARAGTLSTTGQSTNFVVAIRIPSDRPSDYWIAKGAALLCQLSE